MKLALKISRKLSSKLARTMYGSGSSINNALSIPSSLKQLLFHDDGVQSYDPYYSPEQTLAAGLAHDAFLKDYSLGVGDLRPKQLGYKYVFNGTNNYVTAGRRVTTGSVTKLFASCWVKFTGTTTQLFMGEYDSTANTRSWSLYQSSSHPGKLAFYWSADGGGTNIGRYIGSTTINNGAWHHVTAAMIEGVPYLWVDGQAETLTPTNTLGGSSIFNSSTHFAVGAQNVQNTPISFVDGSIFDPRVYQGAAADDALANLSGIIAGTYKGSPVVHWPFQDQAGPTAYDIGPNGYHGTIMNATTTPGVGSIHQPDSGVTVSTLNDDGYTPAFTLKGDAASQSLVYKANGKTVDISFKIKTTDSIGILFGNASGSYFLYWNNTQAGQSLYNSYGTPSVYVDTVLYSERASLSAALADGEEHDVVIQNVTLSSDTYINGYLTGTGTTGVIADVWDLIIDGVPIHGPTKIPNVSATESAIGTTPQFTGRCPNTGLALAPSWQGDGSTVSVALGTPLIPATGDFEVSFPLLVGSLDTNQRYFFAQTIDSSNRVIASYNTNVSTATAGAFALRVASGGTAYYASVSSGLVADTWYDVSIRRVGNAFSITFSRQGQTLTGSVTFAGSVAQGNTNLLTLNPGSGSFDKLMGPVTSTANGVTTTYSPIEGTRNVAVTKSDGTYSVITNAVVNGTLANLYTPGNGSWRVPSIENGAHWDGTGLYPAAPGAEVACNGEAINRPKYKHSIQGGITIDRRGGVNAPGDVDISIDTLTDETADQGVSPAGKRYLEGYSDRYGAAESDISENAFFEPRAFVVSVGTSTSPTSATTKAVTGTGHKPKLILPFGVDALVEGQATPLQMFFGAGEVGAQAGISVSSNNGVTTSDTDRKHTNTHYISPIYNGTGSTTAALASLDADGFTNLFSVAGAARILNHIALGGTNLEVSLTQHQMNGTNAPQSFPHGLTGGAPTALLLFGASVAALPQTTTDLGLAVHLYANGIQYGAAITSENNESTTDTDRYLGTSFFSQVSSAGGFIRAFSITSVDATNVNTTYSTVTLGQNYFSMLAIRGVKTQVGTFDCNGSTDRLTISCPGITMRPGRGLFLPVFVIGGENNLNTVLNGLLFTLGASDGINNVSCGITDVNGIVLNPATTNARRFQSSNSLVEYDSAGSKIFEATTSFSNESVIISPTLNTGSSYGQGAYLILGE